MEKVFFRVLRKGAVMQKSSIQHSPPRRSGSWARFVVSWSVLACLLGGTIACTSTGTLDEGPLDRRRLVKLLKYRGLDPHRVILPYGLTEEMRRWVKEEVPKKYSPEDRLNRLRDGLLANRNLAIEYTWGYTGTAAEVFQYRRANCLAFTNLFLGMAREIGIPVYFLAVENVETYRKEGNLVVISDHIAVGYGDGPSRKIYDFSENPQDDLRFVKKISDLQAIAMFHSNRGAEALQAGSVQDALAWSELAVAIDENLPSAWVNLGVARRRAAQVERAEMAYKKAIELDPRVYSAYHNLAALLRTEDRLSEAEAFEEALADSPNQNPYTYLSLGDLSMEAGRLGDAERFYRRAVSLSEGDAECYAALGQLAVASGDLRLAKKMLRKAQRIEGSGPRILSLASALGGSS